MTMFFQPLKPSGPLGEGQAHQHTRWSMLSRTRAISALLMAFGLALALAILSLPSARAQNLSDPATVDSRALRSNTKVTVNFVNAEVEAVTRAFAAMIERQIAVDPRIKGTITVISDKPQTIREAYRNYLSALRGLGYAMVENAGLLKVVPEADAKLQAGTVLVGDEVTRSDQVLTQIFRLRYENPNNLVPVLRPLISANNTINVTPGTSALVITDYADNLQRLARIIAALDQPSSSGVEIFELKQAVASDVVPLAQKLIDSAAAAAPGGAAAASGGVSLVADSRTNSVLLKAPNRAQLAQALTVLDKLDRPLQGAGPEGNWWVIHLRNAEATQLATVLRAAFAGQAPGLGASGGVGGSGFPGATPAPRAATPTGAATGAQGGAGGMSGNANAPVAGSIAPSTGGFIQADPTTNSLIVTAPEPLYRQVRAMVDQLDTRRAQIYIESMIVEVSGDNAADFGLQWQGLLGNSKSTNGLYAGTNNAIGGPSIIDLSRTLAGQGTTGPGEGLNIGLLRNYGGTVALTGLLRALQTQSNTNIVSTPNLITLDNEEAKIVVGENVPFITGQYTNTGTATTNPFQTIERKDVGITLRIRPQVGEGGTVRMTLFQEQSAVKDTTAAGTSNAGPSTTKRSIESTVVVDDGAILVLGGLIKDEYIDKKSKVPFLGDLPGVGVLFRSESRTKSRTNLMVFLRPRILRDGAASDRLSMDRYDVIRARQELSQPSSSNVLPIQTAPILPELPAAKP
jgi:general secretion pathway protein D